jgi:hypothetical protein
MAEMHDTSYQGESINFQVDNATRNHIFANAVTFVEVASAPTQTLSCLWPSTANDPFRLSHVPRTCTYDPSVQMR